MTRLTEAILSQPLKLRALLRRDLKPWAAKLRGCRCVWLVGTGSSQHAAELGAMALTEAGVDARWAGSYEFTRIGPRITRDDAVVVISHTARTAFAAAGRAAALSSSAAVISITGHGAGWPEALETVAAEQSQTYTVSYTAALMVLYRLAFELGAAAFSPTALESAVSAVERVIAEFDPPLTEWSGRAIVIAGNGPGAVTAREAALKLREAAHILAEGYGAEYLLHGSAVPLDACDSLLLIQRKTDPDRLLSELGAAAQREGLKVVGLDEPSIAHPVLAQLPLTVQAQLLASCLARSRDTDPDRVITGGWADESLWSIGGPR